MSEAVPGRNKAMIAYITLIGLLIAISMNSDNKDEFATQHIKNMFGLTILWIVSQVCVYYVHYIIGDLLWLLSFVLCIYSFYRAYSGLRPNIPFLSDNFQRWFTFLD